MREQDRLLIPEARLVDENEQTIALVQPVTDPSVILRPGRIAYNREAHYGRLRCPYCSLKVLFNKGAETTGAGNLHGPSSHFQKEAGSNHEDHCLIPLRDQTNSEDKIDYTKGYRLRLNVPSLQSMFRRASYHLNQSSYLPPVYERGADRKLHIVHPELVGREGFTIKNADDLLRFMRRGDFDRIRDARFNILHSVYPWEKMAILPATKQDPAARYRTLVNRLLDRIIQPCAIYVGLPRGACGTSIKAKKLFLARDDQNRAHFLSTHLYIDDESARDIFPIGGGYLVLAMPRLNTETHGKTVNHMLNLSIRSPEQVTACDLPALVDAARKNQLRRLAAKAPSLKAE